MTPSPGTMVQYFTHASGYRLRARVEAQREDGTVDLLVYNPDWFPSLAERPAVPVVRDNETRPTEGDFCVWMTTPRSLYEIEPFPLEN